MLDHSPCGGFVRAHRTRQLVRQPAPGTYLHPLESDIGLSVNGPDDIIATHLIVPAALRDQNFGRFDSAPGGQAGLRAALMRASASSCRPALAAASRISLSSIVRAS